MQRFRNLSQNQKITVGWFGMGAVTLGVYYLMYKDVQRKRQNAMEERKQKRLEKKRSQRLQELEEIKASAAKRESSLS